MHFFAFWIIFFINFCDTEQRKSSIYLIKGTSYSIYYIIYYNIVENYQFCKNNKSFLNLPMDFKEIKNTKHYLYDNEAEFKLTYPNIPIRHNWRHGEEGEWVYTDDGFVCQVLRKSKLKAENGKNTTYIRTVCGTFVTTRMNREMLGDDGIPENIYTMSGTNRSRANYKERGCNSKELIFARYMADSIVRQTGLSASEAYKLAFPDAKSNEYIKRKAKSLLNRESMDKMITDEVRGLLDEIGATDTYIIERYKTLADGGETDNAKLKALDSLAKISGLFDKETKKEQVTIWAGFSPEQLEGVKKHGKPELIAHAERDQKENTE